MGWRCAPLLAGMLIPAAMPVAQGGAETTATTPEGAAGEGQAEPMISIKDHAAARQMNAEPSQLWLVGRGATMTTRGGGEFDTTRLHYENFFECVRSREQPTSSFEASFPSTIASHMSTLAFRESRPVHWDAKERKVV